VSEKGREQGEEGWNWGCEIRGAAIIPGGVEGIIGRYGHRGGKIYDGFRQVGKEG
jgi:hypothetical protein